MKRKEISWFIVCLPTRGPEYILRYTGSYYRKGAWEAWEANLGDCRVEFKKSFRKRCRAVKVKCKFKARR